MLSEKDKKIIDAIPTEFKFTLNYIAYEKCHSAGKDEEENALLSLSIDLLPCILAFEKYTINRTIEAIRRGDIKL